MFFLKVIGKIILIITVIVIIVISVLSFLLFTDFGHQKIISVVNERFIPGEIKFEKLSLNLFDFTVEIKNVEIFPPNENRAIFVGNLRTAVDFHTLVSEKKILVKYLKINDVVVNLYFDENGSLNIERAFVNPDQAVEEEFDLQEFLDNGILDLFASVLEIRNAEVNLKMDGISAEVSGINLLAQNIDLRKLSLDLQLNSNKISANADTMNFALDTFSLKLNGSPRLAHLEELFAISSVKDTILLSAVIENPVEIERFAVKLTANSSLNSLQNYNIQVLPNGGRLNLHTKINLKGTLQHPVANIEINADDISILDYSADKISMQIFIDNETLIAENLRAKNIRAQDFKGNLFLNASAKLRPFFPNGLIGGFDSTALAIENISAKAETKISVREAKLNETVNLTAKAQLQNAVAKIDFLNVSLRNRDILEISGTYGILNERINANLRLLPTNISLFNDILKTMVEPQPIENAVVSANANISGTISSPQVSATAAVRDVRALGIWANRVDLSAQYSGAELGKGSGNITVKLDTLTSEFQNISRFSSNASIKDSLINLENLSFFISESDIVQLSGIYRLNGEYRADLSIPNFNLSDIAALAEQEVSGRGRIAVFAEGNINENMLPRTARVSVEIDSLQHQILSDFELPNYQNIYANIEKNEIVPSANGIITIDGGRISFNEKGEVKISQVPVLLADAARIVINGEVLGEDISVNADGEVILERFTHFAAEFLDSVSGAVNFGVKVSGKTAEPTIKASVNLREISGNIILLEQRLHSLSGNILYKNDSVEIENLSGRIDNGDFSITGNIDISDLPNIVGNAQITLENLHLIYPDYANITIDGNIFGEFTQKAAKLSGVIDILNAVYFQDIDMSILSIAGITNQRGAFENLGGGAVSLRRQRAENFPVELDLVVRPRGNIFVQNNLAELSLIPSVSVGGTTQFPSVSGRVSVADGEVFFNNQTFEVRQGIIDFTDPYSIRPEVEITAETTIENYRITLEISGDPQEELFFGFSSVPHLGDQDILSLILFGRIISELGDLHGDLAAAAINDMLGSSVPQGIGIELTDGDVSVSLSRNLSRQFSVKLIMESVGKAAAVQTGVFNWKLSDFLRIRAYSDTRGNNAGIGLEAEFERR